MMDTHLNILSLAGPQGETVWRINPPCPTDLRVVVAGDGPSPLEEVGRALATFVGAAVDVAEMDATDTSTAWIARVRIPALPADAVFWAEEAAPEALELAGCSDGWTLAMQTGLHADDPVGHFADLLRILTGSLAGAAGIVDVNTGRWHPREVLESTVLDAQGDLPEEALWITRVVDGPADAEPADRHAWITTHGLDRCGRAELEMLAVPPILVSDAVQLVDAVAAISLEQDLPAAGVEIPLADECGITLAAPSDVLDRLPPGAPGSGQRDAYCAIITGTEELFPRELVSRLRRGDATIVRTVRSTRRRAEMAQTTWSLLLELAVRVGDREDAACLAQIPFADPSDPDGRREHLWFRIVEVEGSAAVGQLAHAPRVAEGIGPRHREAIACEDVTDWLILTPVGPLSPGDEEAVRDFLHQLGG